MGVLGLWTLLEPVGKPVALETLENKILAVDVSIWLHQATKGFRDASGNPLPNAHLLGVFHRLCKLLFFKIKPVFVFDGGVPQLKRQTIAARQGQRQKASRQASKLNEKLLMNYIRTEVVSGTLGGKARGRPIKKKVPEKDLFELPSSSNLEIAQEEQSNGASSTILSSDSESEDDSSEMERPSLPTNGRGLDIHSVDVRSKEFLSLPPQVQHEILMNLKETRKQNSWAKLHEMPKESDTFSSFQVERLLKRRCLQQRLDEVSREISQQDSAPAPGYGRGSEGRIESRRLVSDSTTHYVLYKKQKQAPESEKREITPETTGKDSPEIIFEESKSALIEEIDLEEDGMSQEQILAVIQETRLAESVVKKNEVELSDASSSEDSLVEVPEILTDQLSWSKVKPEDDIFADVFRNPPVVENRQKAIKHLQALDSGNAIPRAAVPSTLTAIAEVKEIKRAESNKPVSEILEIVEPQIAVEEKLTEQPQQIEVNERFPETPAVQTKAVPEILEIPELLVSQEEKNEVKEVDESFPETPTVQTEAVPEILENPEPQIPAEKKLTEQPELVEVDEHVPESPVVQTEAVPAPTDTAENEKNVKVSDKFTESVRNLKSSGDTERLAQLQSDLIEEQQSLRQQRAQQERMGASLTDEMYLEVQELLRLFGIPFIVAPMEAEAQCAFLDEENITEGSITDDSDIWLFGGRRVYKNFFSQGKYVQFFEAKDICKVFRLSREKLINIALLTGSDYTEGIESVGPVTALEILAEFPGSDIEALKRFSSWLRIVQSKKHAPPENKIRQKLRSLKLKPGFPNEAVVEAYLHPEINSSREKFTWSPPDADGLRDFAEEKLGWNRKATDAVLLPVLQRYSEKTAQMRIDSYFRVQASTTQDIQMSKRVREALNKADFGDTSVDSEGNSSNGHSTARLPAKKRKKSSEVKTAKASTTTATSTTTTTAEESVTPQEQFRRKQLEMNKKRAIEILKKSRQPKKGKTRTESMVQACRPAVLSESDSDE